MYKYILLSAIVISLFSCSSSNQTNETQETEEIQDTTGYHILPKINKTHTKIAIGSCNNHRKPQDFWSTIGALNPDLWIWLGDNIYGDTDNEDSMRAMYNLQMSDSNYTAFAKKVPITGIWDDHDYGLNDGGSDFHFKRKSQDLFFEFMNDTSAEKEGGIYRSYTLGKDDKSILLAMLDTRYFKESPVATDSTAYRQVLGEAQWRWLYETIHNSKSDLVLLASGIQVISEEQRFETWGQYPMERQRLLEIACSYPEKQFIILSGDRHISEFSKQTVELCGRDVFDFTSSGLTHAYRNFTGEPNRYRIGEVYFDRSFGMLNIDWDKRIVTSEIYSIDGNLIQAHPIKF